MRFALHFANFVFPEPDRARRVAAAAEAAGFDSLFTVEHVVVPVHYDSVYPYSPTGKLPGGDTAVLPEPLVWMAYVAAATQRLRLVTGVLVLPQRNPLVTAKEVATLDYLSGGRVELGIGVGWLREEFEAIGVDFSDRGARTDEYVAAMRALWASDGASFAGPTVGFERVSCNPKPVQPGGVPIVVGGATPAAARRAGRLGDGFFPATGAVDAPLAELIALMRHTASEAGRDPHRVEVTAGCPGLAGADPLGAVAELAEVGVDRIAVPASMFSDDPEAQIARFGQAVIAEVPS